jgi:hypothetical protein
MDKLFLLCLIAGPVQFIAAQTYWQQCVDYQMEIDFDVATHRFEGHQNLKYYNRSPDTLTQAFYHLYFNAFQPGSMMDIRARQAPDPDVRLLGIPLLKSDEQGFLYVQTLTQDEIPVVYEENGTVLKVHLARPLYPGDSTLLRMRFSGQVPKQTRRSGRNNAEGISYSMSQWYPKICAYDQDGWHPNPYIGREFYGDFGDFEVQITIDKDFIVAGSGQLKNAESIGYGYEHPGVMIPDFTSDKLTWHFVAENVHDFVWAADPDYTHTKFTREDGTIVHYFFQETEENSTQWAKLPHIMDRAFDIINKRFGQYPYPVYSFIQAGDGGMEYPMATLITGNRSLTSLVGVAVHELLHSWYHTVLATNESLYAWMDEGFANYAEAIVMLELEKEGLIPKEHNPSNIFEANYQNYFQLVRMGIEEPMSVHADHFAFNTAYSMSAYSKGCIFLAQLEYIIGSEAMQRVMKRYFDTWKFRHPRPSDFMHIAEMESGLVLDWYYEYWILTTKTINYGIESVQPNRSETVVTLRRTGPMPMPVEVKVRHRNGDETWFYIPLDLMRGHLKEGSDHMWIEEDWDWVNPSYKLILPVKLSQLISVEIDPSGRLADVNRADNIFTIISDQE